MVKAGAQHSFSEIQLFGLINNPINFILFLPKIPFIMYQKKKTNIIFPEIQLFWLNVNYKSFILFLPKIPFIMYQKKKTNIIFLKFNFSGYY